VTHRAVRRGRIDVITRQPVRTSVGRASEQISMAFGWLLALESLADQYPKGFSA
jgi:hypothetical protein